MIDSRHESHASLCAPSIGRFGAPTAIRCRIRIHSDCAQRAAAGTARLTPTRIARKAVQGTTQTKLLRVAEVSGTTFAGPQRLAKRPMHVAPSPQLAA